MFKILITVWLTKGGVLNSELPRYYGPEAVCHEAVQELMRRYVRPKSVKRVDVECRRTEVRAV